MAFEPGAFTRSRQTDRQDHSSLRFLAGFDCRRRLHRWLFCCGSRGRFNCRCRFVCDLGHFGKRNLSRFSRGCAWFNHRYNSRCRSLRCDRFFAFFSSTPRRLRWRLRHLFRLHFRLNRGICRDRFISGTARHARIHWLERGRLWACILRRGLFRFAPWTISPLLHDALVTHSCAPEQRFQRCRAPAMPSGIHSRLAHAPVTVLPQHFLALGQPPNGAAVRISQLWGT